MPPDRRFPACYSVPSASHRATDGPERERDAFLMRRSPNGHATMRCGSSLDHHARAPSCRAAASPGAWSHGALSSRAKGVQRGLAWRASFFFLTQIFSEQPRCPIERASVDGRGRRRRPLQSGSLRLSPPSAPTEPWLGQGGCFLFPRLGDGDPSLVCPLSSLPAAYARAVPSPPPSCGAAP